MRRRKGSGCFIPDQAAPDDKPSLAALGFLTLGRRFLGVTREIIDRVPRRSPEGNKYKSGHVVVVGGSERPGANDVGKQ